MFNFVKLIKNDEVKKYTANTVWVLLEKIIRMFTVLFVTAWVARYLKPDNFGYLNLAQSIVFIFTFLTTLGLDNVVVKNLVSCDKDSSKLLGTAFLLKLIGAIFVVGMLGGTLIWLDINADLKLMIIIISLSLIFQSFNVIDFFFQSKVLSKYVSYSNFVVLAISSLTKILLIAIDASVEYFAWVFVLDSLTLAIFLFYFYVKGEYKKITWDLDLSLAKKLLRESFPLILSSASVAIAMRLDQVMLYNYLSSTEVGYYSAGVKLAEAAVFIPVAIINSVYPKLVKLDYKKDLFTLQKILIAPTLMLCVISIIVTLLSGFISDAIFGTDYASTSKVLSILIWTLPFTYIGAFIGRLMLIEGFSKFIFYRQLMILILNVIFNIILIPILGVVGAAIATLSSDIIINIFFHYAFKKTRHYHKLFFHWKN